VAGVSETGFCPDCNHDRSAGDQVISFTPDHGWTAEFSMLVADAVAHGTDLADVPVIGWAVVERHYEGMLDGGHDREIQPVLLAEGEYPVTMREYVMDHNMDGVHTQITRSGPGEPGAWPGAVA
jgi:hypothetical protein